MAATHCLCGVPFPPGMMDKCLRANPSDNVNIRLVLCKHCKKAYAIIEETREIRELTPDEKFKVEFHACKSLDKILGEGRP